MQANLLEFLKSMKMEDNLLIPFLGLILLFLSTFIFFIVRSLFFQESLERKIYKKAHHKEYSEVIRLANDFLENNQKQKKSNSLLILYYLGMAYEATSSFSNALKCYLDAGMLAVKSKKLYHSILLHTAKSYNEIGKSKEALAYYLMLLEQDSSNIEALYDLAKFHYQNKNGKKARGYLEKLLKKRPGLLDARLIYGKIFLESGAYSSALKQFELLKKYDRDNFEVHYYRAKTLENLKRYSDAVKNYQWILSQDWAPSDQIDIQKAQEECKISVINLYIKVKDYQNGIRFVSEYLGKPGNDETKIELIYLYANLLWNSGEEYQALKNFERIYKIKSDYKDVSIIYERYKKILPQNYLARYFTSDEESERNNFDGVCRRILGKHQFNLLYKHSDFYIYSKGVFYIIFYRHIEPIAFSKLTDIEVILNSYKVKSQNAEIYSLSGVREDAVTHFLLKNARLIEGEEFIMTLKKLYLREGQV
jgi:tetratricopeptide (TPR) repeat protein